MSHEAAHSGGRWLLTVEAGVLEAIGRVTVHFAHLEGELDQLIWSLVAGFDVLVSARDPGSARTALEGQRRGQAVTAKLQFRAKVQIMVALLTEVLPKEEASETLVATLKQALESLAEERNRVVHAAWAGKGGGAVEIPPGAAVSLKSVLVAGEGMRDNVSLHTQEQLATLADTIAALGYQLAQLRPLLLAESSLGPAAG